MVKEKNQKKILSPRSNDEPMKKSTFKQEHPDDSGEFDRFKAYNGTTKIKKISEKEVLTNQTDESSKENQSSMVGNEPVKKRLSVQFYPVERVQFISNRIVKIEK